MAIVPPPAPDAEPPSAYGLTEADRADLHARLAAWFGDDRQAFLVSHLAPLVDRIKADGYIAGLAAGVEIRASEFQRAALETARKADQAERRAEDAEAEVERLRSLLTKVQRVFDLQCPPMLPSKYDDRGAWMAHAWWDKVLGPVLQQVTACEWCAQQDGHANGCRLGRGPDEGECEHHWLDRPESDTRECLICGTEVAG